MLFTTDKVMSPYCYRCPFNRAKPERDDARNYRQCNWECVGKVEQKFSAQKKKGNPFAAFVFEPLMQGAAGMIPQPARLAEPRRRNCARPRRVAHRGRGDDWDLAENPTWHRERESRLSLQRSLQSSLLDVRTRRGHDVLFACHHENVQPDFLCLAKGLTGGYLPMAATLTTQKIFDAFLGEYEEFKTFFHGHSFTGNQLGAAAALASLEILQSEAIEARAAEIGNDFARRIATALAFAKRRRHPAGRPGRGHRTRERLAHARTV